jgi:hypothetical protein
LDGRPQKLPGDQIGFGFKAFSSESLPRTRSALEAGSREENASEQESIFIQSEDVI